MGTKKKIFSYFLIYIILLLTAFVIYKPALSSYFFQDDWFTFKISQASNIREFMQFFIPRTDVIYYRPLGMQVYFFLMKSLFGINPLPFRLSTLLIYSLNGLLLYFLLLQLRFSKTASFFGGLFYTASVATYIPFFWSATFPFVLAPTFFLFSFLSYISLDKKILSFLFYILGLLTLEIVAVLPVVIFTWEILYNKRKTIRSTFLYLIPLILLVYLRLVAFPIPLVDTYTPKIRILSTLRNYFLWSFNFPEEIGRQMVSYFKINQEFLRDFGGFVKIWFFITFIIIVFLILLPQLTKLWRFVKTKQFKIYIGDVFGLTWYLIGLIPLLLFSNHAFPYYLPIPLIGLLIFLVSQVDYLFKYYLKILPIRLLFISFFIIIWIYSSLTTVSFNQLVHWAPQRAKLAKDGLEKAYLERELINKNQIFFISSSFRLPLNGQDAIQFMFNNDNIRTIYEPENL